jgi:hypothetical protein
MAASSLLVAILPRAGRNSKRFFGAWDPAGPMGVAVDAAGDLSRGLVGGDSDRTVRTCAMTTVTVSPAGTPRPGMSQPLTARSAVP